MNMHLHKTSGRSKWSLGLLGFFLLSLIWGLQVTPAKMAPEDIGDWEGTAPGNLLSTPGNNDAISPAIAYSPDGTVLAAVYLQYTGSFFTPYVRLSTNDGGSWSAPTAVSTSSTVNANWVDVTIDSNNKVHIVWLENTTLGQPSTVYYSNNIAGSWSGAQILVQTTSIFQAAVIAPRIVASPGNKLDVVWSQVFPDTQPQLNIMHRRSNNNGTSWGTLNPVAITAPNSFNPILAVSADGKIHVVWEEVEIVPPNLDYGRVRYAQGVVSGSGTTPSWNYNASNPINLAHSSIDQASRPTIVAIGNKLYVAYNNRDGGEEAQEVWLTSCTVSCTSAANWISHPMNPVSGDPIGANTQDPFYVIPDLVTYDNCLAAYYHGTDGNASHPTEVAFGVNSCTGWGGHVDRATEFNTRATYPRITSDGNWLQLVFELRDYPQTGDIQIYHRRRPVPDVLLAMPLNRR